MRERKARRTISREAPAARRGSGGRGRGKPNNPCHPTLAPSDLHARTLTRLGSTVAMRHALTCRSGAARSVPARIARSSPPHRPQPTRATRSPTPTPRRAFSSSVIRNREETARPGTLRGTSQQREHDDSVNSSRENTAEPATTSHPNSLDFAGAPFRLAVVGAGPAGFYAASRLLSLPRSDNVRVDMYEELPVPFGLVRYGVAPDHPEVKVSGGAAGQMGSQP